MTPQDRPKIEKGYTDNNGNYFNINNVIFPINNTPYCFGEFITSSHDDENINFSDEEVGKQIYRAYDDQNKGYRIYKDLFFWTDNFICYEGVFDARLVAKLQEKQSKIKLTDFPTGVVTINNSVIGQEIPFYSDYVDLHRFGNIAGRERNDLDILTNLKSAYLSIVESIEEMVDNNISYTDIHRGNFLVNKKDFSKTKVIDFEDLYIKFGVPNAIDVYTMVTSLTEMFDKVNWAAGIEYEFEDLDTKNPFKDLKQKIKTFK